MEACTLLAYAAPSRRKYTKSFHVVYTKFNNSFEREKDIDQFLTVPIMRDKMKIRIDSKV